MQTRGRTWRALFVLLFAVVLLRTAWVSDDAFISLRTIDNFVHGYGLRWNVAERVCAFTHPLWLVVVAAFYSITHEAFYTVTTLSCLISLSTFALIAFAAHKEPLGAITGLSALVLSQSFVDYSTSGLENPLTHLLIVLAVLALARDRMLAAGLCVGLAVLNRMDIVLLLGPALALALVRGGTLRGVGRAAIGFVPFALWELFSLVYYGSLFPNTAVAKLGTGLGASDLAPQGLRYLENSLRNDPLTLAVIAAAVSVALIHRGARTLALAAGIVAYLVYVVSIGGDFMAGRFLSAPFVAAVMLLATSELPSVGFRQPVLLVVVFALGLIGPRPTVTSGADAGLLTAGLLDRYGIADERRFYFASAGLFNAAPGWTRPVAQATEHARIARRNGSPLLVEGMAGVVGYFAGPGVHIVDLHGLGDPLLSRLPIVASDTLYADFLFEYTRNTPARPWRIGHFLRNVPPGYLETMLDGVNRIRDPQAAALYDKVAVLTRGPIWSAARLRLIAKPGSLRGLATGARPEYRLVPWDDVIRARPDDPQAYFERGRLLRIQKRLDDAAVAFEQALARDPRHIEALRGLGDVQREMGRPAAAIATWRRALDLVPDSAVLHHRVGEALLDQGQAQAALEEFQRALALDPSLAPAYGNLGVTFIRLGRFADALPWLERAREAAPRVPETHENLGYALLQLDEPRRALEMFERTLELAPQRANAAFMAANSQALLGDNKAAQRLLERTVEISPDHAEAHFILGQLADEAGRQEQALESWRRSARLGFAPAQETLNARGLDW